MWRACNLTTFTPCLTGPPICFPSWGTRVQIPGGGYLCETRILLLALSRYISDPDVIWSLALSPLRGASLGFAPTICKPTLWTWSHSSSVPVSRLLQVLLPASQPTEAAARGEPCGEPAIALHSHHVSLVQWTTRLLPFMWDPGSNPQEDTYVKPGFSC